jgi:hypothetical protein
MNANFVYKQLSFQCFVKTADCSGSLNHQIQTPISDYCQNGKGGHLPHAALCIFSNILPKQKELPIGRRLIILVDVLFLGTNREI